VTTGNVTTAGEPRKRMGRPTTVLDGRTVNVFIPAHHIQWLNQKATEANSTRSEVLRRLLERAMQE